MRTKEDEATAAKSREILIANPNTPEKFVPAHADYFRATSFNGLGEHGWYEEDCDAAIVMSRFEPAAVSVALDVLASYMPSQYERWMDSVLLEVARA